MKGTGRVRSWSLVMVGMVVATFGAPAAQADTNTLYGTNGSDTIAYGDILYVYYDKVGECEGWFWRTL